jgi:hypothetical protein
MQHVAGVAVDVSRELRALATSPASEPGEAVARVDATDDGFFAEILPDRSVTLGQLLYTHPAVAAQVSDGAVHAALCFLGELETAGNTKAGEIASALRNRRAQPQQVGESSWMGAKAIIEDQQVDAAFKTFGENMDEDGAIGIVQAIIGVLALYAAAEQPANPAGDGEALDMAALYGMFRAIVDAGGPTTIARHGVERGSDEWEKKVRAGMIAIERAFHPSRFDETAPTPRTDEPAGGVDALVERACRDLPTGYLLSIYAEAGAGWVELHGPMGVKVNLDVADRTIAEQVEAALTEAAQ